MDHDWLNTSKNENSKFKIKIWPYYSKQPDLLRISIIKFEIPIYTTLFLVSYNFFVLIFMSKYFLNY